MPRIVFCTLLAVCVVAQAAETRNASPCPEDFQSFWQTALREAGEQDVKLEPLPEYSKDRNDVYRIRFEGAGDCVISGWLTEPKAVERAPFPTRIRLNGDAGELSRPSGQDWEVTLQLDVPAITKDAVAGLNRVVDWLAGRPTCNARDFTLSGTGRGGELSLALAALNRHITRCCVFVPEGGADRSPYLNGANFARHIVCPIRFVAGGSDGDSVPDDAYGAYRVCASKDKAILSVEKGRSPGKLIRSRLAAWEAGKDVDRRPQVCGRLVDPDDADYLRRKWREDVTDNGLGIPELTSGALELARKKVDAGEDWQLAKAEVFAWLCDNAGVGASEHDFFPALSVYSRDQRPMCRVTRWRNVQIDERLLKKEKEAASKAWGEGRFAMWKDFDHSVPDWETLLAGGWPMLERRLRTYWKDTDYYRSLRVTLDACTRTISRFADEAEKRAGELKRMPASECPNRDRGIARLEREAAALRKILKEPPGTVYEALLFQFTYFFLSEHLDGLQVRSLGMIDQLLTPYYRADLAAGRITPEEFRTLLAHFWWQWGSIDNYWGQPVGLGGTLADGSSAYNEVSDLVMDVHDELALPTPKMLAKVATNTPERVLGRMLDLARRNRPIAFNSEETMAEILRGWRGCTEKDDWRTCVMNGCYEFYVCGRQNITQTSHINFLQPVSDLLSRYMKTPSGGLPATFGDFKAAYLAELKRNTLECCELTDAWERSLGEINPGNLFSLAVESAVASGKDAYSTGHLYNDTGLLSVALGTTVDALLAVKEIVYERREMSLGELGALMAADWKGGEQLRRRMLRSRRKWGTNDSEANRLGAEISHAIGGWVNGRKNSRGGIWGFSGHPAKQFVVLMQQTGATPDGRHAGEEASKNVSATMGMDTEGVTALIDSVAGLDPLDLPLNQTLDVMMHPSSVRGAEGLAAMSALVRVYFANGGLTIQFNVLDVAALKDAQKHPEKYENLQVRVCGWNVRWNDIPKSEQDKYIYSAERMAR